MIQSPLDLVLSRLENVKAHKGGRQFTALCPAHDDHRPSLSISVGDNEAVILHCQVGCTMEQVVEAMGLQVKDLFPGGKVDRVSLLEQKMRRLERTQKAHAERLTKIEQLQRAQMHLVYHRNLTTDTRMLWYRQGVFDEMIDQFLLGYVAECPTYRESPARTIPVFGYNSELVNIRHRLLRPGKGGKYRPQMNGLGLALFNAAVLNNTSHERLLVLEGEVKVVVLSQAGYAAVGLMGQGARWQPEWLEWLDDVGQIVVCLDPGAEKRAWELGRGFVERGFRDVRVAVFPLKPDDLVVRCGAGKAHVDSILNLARPVRA